MLDFLSRTKQYLWMFVEIGFLTVLSIILIHLLLGPNSGIFVTSVADNVLKFAAKDVGDSGYDSAILVDNLRLVAE